MLWFQTSFMEIPTYRTMLRGLYQFGYSLMEQAKDLKMLNL
ncbi:alpha/beta-Hydrolases superfamily protein [Prunus dulcis]|uniref:Alpha/beta-Hydrolases superfamily protein n=1 Tax=Prunus dulcis TaxID=3755 RepID=A0A4Y1S1Y8_PRUDU|nr:alpha/beta-Hydrolases superfamily protein [Prunus dulcis]